MIKSSMQFVKFGLVGVLNTIIGYGIFYFLVFIKVHYLISLVTSFAISVLNSYGWNRLWVFASHGNHLVEFPKFISVYLITLAINFVLLPIFVEFFKFDPKVAQLFFVFFLPVVTFLGFKYWSFA